MSLDPQSLNTRRSRWLVSAAVVLMAGWGLAARADIYVHVMNCSDDSVVAEAFDAKDSVKVVVASKASFKFGNPGASEQLHCAGEGKGYCQMEIGTLSEPDGCDPSDDNVSVDFHLDSGKWAVVKGFAASDGKCKAVVEENLDAAPSSCS